MRAEPMTEDQQRRWKEAAARVVAAKLAKDSRETNQTKETPMEPRNKVTKQHIEDRIKDVDYFRLPGTTVTVCNIALDNGFSVRGESACVDPANYDEKKGKEDAYEKAFDKLWELEGYLLAEERWRVARGDTNQFANEQDRQRHGLLTEISDMLGVNTFEEILPKLKPVLEMLAITRQLG